MNIKTFKSIAANFIIIFLLVGYTSCEDPFQYNPNEIVLSDDEKDLNRKNINRILNLSPSDTLKFILISDTHHEYEYLNDFVGIANTLQNISFVLVSGDVTDFGMQFEYKATNDILKKLAIPYVVAVGNHDLLGNGSAVFEEMYGKKDFSFILHGNKFIFLNTNSREYNFNGRVPDVAWLRSELKETDTYTKAFIAGHVSPFDSDFDSALEDSYVNAITEFGKVKVSMHGHAHNYYLGHYYNNGIDLLLCRDMRSREYTLFKVWDNSYSIETISF